jgi:hypothetical protein
LLSQEDYTMTASLRALNPFITCVASGILITAALMLVPYEYCIDGTGRGLPLAVLHPMHGSSAGVVRLQADTKGGQGLDFLGLASDSAMWSALLAGVCLYVRKTRDAFRKFAELRKQGHVCR